jgi:hypothetical protein
VGQVPDASMNELELGADDHPLDEHPLVSEVAPQVGQTPDAEAELALGADEHQVESESEPDTSDDGVEFRAHEASGQSADIGQLDDEASNEKTVELSSNVHGDEVELSGEEDAQELTSDEDVEGDSADKSSDPDDSSAN